MGRRPVGSNPYTFANCSVKYISPLERLKLDKGIKSQEDVTVAAEPEEITNSIATLEFLTSVIPTAEPEHWLAKQKLIIGKRPTAAGMILFADEPQITIPKSAIKIYRYITSESEGTRETLAGEPASIDGNAYKQIYACIAAVKEIIEKTKRLGAKGMEEFSYPEEAIHEIITNAVIHRDYSLQDDVHVRIFNNQIEVQSPGLLPGHITVANILDERAARNPRIVRLLNKFPNPPNKDVGEGMNTAFQAMRKLKLRDPEIEQKTNSVLVTLRHEKLAAPEEIILEYLERNEEINNTKAREICFIGSENAVKRIFNKMIEAGLIKRIPGRPLSKTGYTRGPNYAGKTNPN